MEAGGCDSKARQNVSLIWCRNYLAFVFRVWNHYLDRIFKYRPRSIKSGICNERRGRSLRKFTSHSVFGMLLTLTTMHCKIIERAINFANGKIYDPSNGIVDYKDF